MTHKIRPELGFKFSKRREGRRVKRMFYECDDD
jgi:hypothetical protein